MGLSQDPPAISAVKAAILHADLLRIPEQQKPRIIEAISAEYNLDFRSTTSDEVIREFQACTQFEMLLGVSPKTAHEEYKNGAWKLILQSHLRSDLKPAEINNISFSDFIDCCFTVATLRHAASATTNGEESAQKILSMTAFDWLRYCDGIETTREVQAAQERERYGESANLAKKVGTNIHIFELVTADARADFIRDFLTSSATTQHITNQTILKLVSFSPAAVKRKFLDTGDGIPSPYDALMRKPSY